MSSRGSPLVSPINVSFTSLNGGSFSKCGNSVILDVVVQAANAHSIVGAYVSAPAAPYCVIMNICNNQGDQANVARGGDTCSWGTGFYDGTKLVMMSWQYRGSSTTVSMANYVTEFSNVNTASSTVFGSASPTGYPSNNVNWMQVRDDGTNIYFYVATDGKYQQPSHWAQVYSQSRTAYLSAPTYVFWGADAISNQINYTYLTLNSWQQVAL